ncbi:DUF2927 domain-containing protein [uncultured Paracoccus sp.]|uniref:DUF2927 domain-containing protein n=1 Tax=uncultured Paracoccus sp. TaxID=189685 RepID=UPI00262CDB0D|nr:DUF2927 domain-containing protein [uncultured Paracoccus sp.]
MSVPAPIRAACPAVPAAGQRGRAAPPRLLGVLLLTSALALAGCATGDRSGAPDDGAATDASAAAPAPRPAEPPSEVRQAALRKERAERARAAEAAAAQPPSPASQTMRRYLAGIEDTLIARGLMRTDRGDVPTDAARLVEDFVAVALRDEYERQGGALVRRVHDAPLRRWSGPVRLQLDFGASVDAATRTRDRAAVADYAARLSQASGHPITLTGSGGNFAVLFVSEDDRRSVGPRLARLVPGIPAADVQAIVDLKPQNYCTVFAYSRGAAPEYVRAVAVIRAELPERMRLSCIHEELAQGLGLTNDSPAVRPSIFNDDEEFALLTRHDELLLRILYDRRLRPGMTEAEARPIAARIAAELTGAPPAEPARHSGGA